MQRLIDLLGRRWTLRVLWDLRNGPLRFGELQAEEISTSVLTQRLRELTEARIVEQRPDTAYALSPLGHDAYRALRPLVRWSDDWAAALADEPAPA